MIITSADNGGAIVIHVIKQYFKEAGEHLINT